jgi:dihydropteroate synthase
MYSINCKGKMVKLDMPVVMGIINVTPDSFYKGNIDDDIIFLAEKMLHDGAAILDIGGQSTRPGSAAITVDDELKRVVPVIEKLHNKFPEAIISVDTFQSKVAAAAVATGASIVNDISAGNIDAAMIDTVAALQVPYVCMHMQGTPATMQQNPVYTNLIKEVYTFFEKKITECKKAGIADIIIDPGFGFGKTIEHNFQLLQNLSAFNKLGKPLLAGLSRKSPIYKTLNTTAENALNGTTVMNTIALLNGATILRVHDVKEAMECIALVTAYKKTPLR